MMRRTGWALALALITGSACTNAGENLATNPMPRGFLVVKAFFDRDVSHTLTTSDTIYAGLRVALLAPGGNDTIRVGVTDAIGQIFFDTLPVGTYRLAVVRRGLPDSVGIAVPDSATVRLVNQTTTQFDSLRPVVVLRLGYPEVSLADARAMPAGRRVIVWGRVVGPLQAFRDSSAFLVDSSGALRITGSRPRAGAGGNFVGDSVAVLGTTGVRSGQGVLQNGVFTTFASGVPALPQIVTVAEAHDARGGALDAVLIQLSNVKIVDTVGSGPDFAVTVADPADNAVTTTVLLDQLVNAPRTAFVPGRTGTFRGVLVPQGDGTWVLKPRGSIDVVLN